MIRHAQHESTIVIPATSTLVIADCSFWSPTLLAYRLPCLYPIFVHPFQQPAILLCVVDRASVMHVLA